MSHLTNCISINSDSSLVELRFDDKTIDWFTRLTPLIVRCRQLIVGLSSLNCRDYVRQSINETMAKLNEQKTQLNSGLMNGSIKRSVEESDKVVNQNHEMKSLLKHNPNNNCNDSLKKCDNHCVANESQPSSQSRTKLLTLSDHSF